MHFLHLRSAIAMPTALVFAGCLTAATLILHWYAAVELARTNRDIAVTQQEEAPTAPTVGVELDFVQHLPATTQLPVLLQELLRSTKARGVVLAAVSSSFQEPTDQTLGRTSISISLQGAYPEIKGVLADALARFSNMSLYRLTIQRRGTPVDLDARVELVLYSRPTHTRAVQP